MAARGARRARRTLLARSTAARSMSPRCRIQTPPPPARPVHRPLLRRLHRCRRPRPLTLVRRRSANQRSAATRQQRRPLRCRDQRRERRTIRRPAVLVPRIAASLGPIRTRQARRISPRRGLHHRPRHRRCRQRRPKPYPRKSHCMDRYRCRGTGQASLPSRQQRRQQWPQPRRLAAVRCRCRACVPAMLPPQIPARLSRRLQAGGANSRTRTDVLAHCNTEPLSIRTGS
jgi:hypothetical protein